MTTNFLQKCNRGETQNANESSYGVIQSMLPKTIFAPSISDQLGCSIVVCKFNHGRQRPYCYRHFRAFLGFWRPLLVLVLVLELGLASFARHDSVRVEKSKRVSNTTAKCRRNYYSFLRGRQEQAQLASEGGRSWSGFS